MAPPFISTLLWFSLISLTLKLLLIPSYHSTDFAVHLNWLALTHSLPIAHWYSDAKSPWTLDYPPFFAFFEFLLSYPAKLLVPTSLERRTDEVFDGDHAILGFQRVSVMVADLVLHYAIWRITKRVGGLRGVMIWVLVIWGPGLLMVDHVHFQYNGMLLGVLVWSMGLLREERDLMGGFVFAVLLCFKHLFAVAGPVYFVYLLRRCFRDGGFWRGFGRLVVLGVVVVVVFVAAFGPFVYYGQILQVIHRMFPFGRGLCHAYWAPNFWVFYILSDKALAFVLRRLGLSIPRVESSFTGGLVGDSSPFAVLPKVTPLVTFALVLLALFPCLIKAWKNPQPRNVTRWIAYAYTSGFLFGWHVHEKASLHFVIPLTLVAVENSEEARHYFILSIVSCYSLFPLLFEPQEYPLKVLLLLLHSALMWYGFSSLFPGNGKPKVDKFSEKKNLGSKPERRSLPATGKDRFCIGWVGKAYLLGIVVVEVWGQFLQPVVLGDRLPFLPLLLISVYCAFGMMYSWLWQLKSIILLP
ncbi:hypothetical protein Droror1_Dr00011386 [Drosera rotundifolia]